MKRYSLAFFTVVIAGSFCFLAAPQAQASVTAPPDPPGWWKSCEGKYAYAYWADLLEGNNVPDEWLAYPAGLTVFDIDITTLAGNATVAVNLYNDFNWTRYKQFYVRVEGTSPIAADVVAAIQASLAVSPSFSGTVEADYSGTDWWVVVRAHIRPQPPLVTVTFTLPIDIAHTWGQAWAGECCELMPQAFDDDFYARFDAAGQVVFGVCEDHKTTACTVDQDCVDAGYAGPCIDSGGDGVRQDAQDDGWYEYPLYDWRNMWFYDHRHAWERMKLVHIHLEVDWPASPASVFVALNWSLPPWSLLLNPESEEVRVPPLPADVGGTTLVCEDSLIIPNTPTGCTVTQDCIDAGFEGPCVPVNTEDLTIGRVTLFEIPDLDAWLAAQDPPPAGPPYHFDLKFLVRDFNPEWVSVDVRATNAVVSGTIHHECTGDIPAVSTWGLVALTLLVLSAGSVVIMRRRAMLA